MKDYKVPVKLEKHLKKNKKAWSRKGLVAILTYSLAIFLLGVIGKSCWDGYWRTHSWRFQSPVIFQTPVIIKEVKPQAQTLSPIAEDAKTQGSAQIKPKLSTVEPFKKFLTPEANEVRTRLLPLIAKDYPEVDDQVSLDNILKKEAGYRADANSNNTCGMVQAQPCAKLPCSLDYSDEAISCQYSWIKSYIANRYETPSLAWRFHEANNYY